MFSGKDLVYEWRQTNLLNLPTPSTPVMLKTGRARVLTSSECLKLMKDKEETKQQVATEKEKEERKKERERKSRTRSRKVRKERERAERAREKSEKVRQNSVKSGENRSACDSGKENNLRPKRLDNDMDSSINTDK